MIKFINYLKYVGIFLIVELLITFLTSLLNLFGLSSGITTIILLICNLILFFILSFFNAWQVRKKGLIEGAILGIIFIIFMLLIKLALFPGTLRISTFIYYIILLFSSILGGMFGVNKKSNKN